MNALHVAPVRGADGALKFFVGVQLDVSSEATLGEKFALNQRTPHPTHHPRPRLPVPVARFAPHTPSSHQPPPLCAGTAPTKPKLSHRMAHMGVTGTVRVACRSLAGRGGGLRRSMECQGLPGPGYGRRLSLSVRPTLSSGSSEVAVGDLGPEMASGPAAVGQVGGGRPSGGGEALWLVAAGMFGMCRGPLRSVLSERALNPGTPRSAAPPQELMHQKLEGAAAQQSRLAAVAAGEAQPMRHSSPGHLAGGQ